MTPEAYLYSDAPREACIAPGTATTIGEPKCDTSPCLACWLEAQVRESPEFKEDPALKKAGGYQFSREPLDLNIVGIRLENSLTDIFDDTLVVVFRQLQPGPDSESSLKDRIEKELQDVVKDLVKKVAEPPRVVECSRGGPWVVAKFAITTDPGMEARRRELEAKHKKLEEQLAALQVQKANRRKLDEALKALSDAIKKKDGEKAKLDPALRKRNEPRPGAKSDHPLQGLIDDIDGKREDLAKLQKDNAFKNLPTAAQIDKAIGDTTSQRDKVKTELASHDSVEKEFHFENKGGMEGWYAEGRALMTPGQYKDYRFYLHKYDNIERNHVALITGYIPGRRLYVGKYIRLNPFAKGVDGRPVFLNPRRATRMERGGEADTYGFGKQDRLPGLVVKSPKGKPVEVSVAGVKLAPLGPDDKVLLTGSTSAIRVSDIQASPASYQKRRSVQEIQRASGAKERFHVEAGPLVAVTRSPKTLEHEVSTYDEAAATLSKLADDGIKVTFAGETDAATVKEIRADPEGYMLLRIVREAKLKDGTRKEYRPPQKVTLEVGWDGSQFTAYLDDAGKATILDDEDLVLIEAVVGGTNIHRAHQTRLNPDAYAHPDQGVLTPGLRWEQNMVQGQEEATTADWYRVHNWSEGCQTFPRFSDFNLFLRLCAISKRYRCQSATKEKCKLLELGKKQGDAGPGGAVVAAHFGQGPVDDAADGDGDYGGAPFERWTEADDKAVFAELKAVDAGAKQESPDVMLRKLREKDPKSPKLADLQKRWDQRRSGRTKAQTIEDLANKKRNTEWTEVDDNLLLAELRTADAGAGKDGTEAMLNKLAEKKPKSAKRAGFEKKWAGRWKPENESELKALLDEQVEWRKEFLYERTARYRFDFLRTCDLPGLTDATKKTYAPSCEFRFTYNLIEMPSLEPLGARYGAKLPAWDGSLILKKGP